MSREFHVQTGTPVVIDLPYVRGLTYIGALRSGFIVTTTRYRIPIMSDMPLLTAPTPQEVGYAAASFIELSLIYRREFDHVMGGWRNHVSGVKVEGPIDHARRLVCRTHSDWAR